MTAYRAFEYGVRITEWPQEATDQLRRKGAYWNRLVELEQAFRGRIDEAVEPYLHGETEEEKRRSRRAALGREDVKQAIRQAAEEHNAQWRQSRKASGLYWGNYLDVEAAYRRARQSRPRGLRFHHARDEGSLSIWFLKGLPVQDVWGGNPFLAIGPVPTQAWSSSKRAERRRLCRTTFRFRIGTSGNHQPMYLSGTVVLHRPPPSEGTIRIASLARVRIADAVRYRLVLTVASQVATRTDRETVTGVDLGWRKMPEGLRVAVAVDQAGVRHDLVLPPQLLMAFDQLRGLQAVRDRAFNEARDALANWRDQQADVPHWFRDETARLRQWRSAPRLRELLERWADRHWPGDDAGYRLLWAWFHGDGEGWHGDRHLWRWQAHQRDQARAHRRELYRRFAAQIARSCGMLVLEHFDIRSVMGKGELSEVARMRAIASAGELRSILEHTAEREGVPVVFVSSIDTTRTCHCCGAAQEDFGPLKEMRHRCWSCGNEWDQDENAAHNLIQAALDGGAKRQSGAGPRQMGLGVGDRTGVRGGG